MTQASSEKRCQQSPPSVVALIYDGLCTFEFGIVAEIFGLPRPELGRDLYRFSSVALDDQSVRAAGGLQVTASGSHQDFESADIVIVPGWCSKDTAVPDKMCEELQKAHARGSRLVSICSGVYVLAAAGLLRGRSVTTHWQYVSHFKEKYPDIVVMQDNLYVEDGNIITSAGSSAGIDACLHIVRNDYGARIANSVARRLVMHAHRRGGQTQFIEQPVPNTPVGDRLSNLIDELRAHLCSPHDIHSMAGLAGMSPRTFQRKFTALTGVPAMQWLNQERVTRASQLLETTDLSIDQISIETGFASAEVLRYHFRHSLNVSPIEYRKRFSAQSAVSDPALAQKHPALENGQDFRRSVIN